MSQADLAGDSLSGSAISLLEAGRREPTLPTLKLLASRLGCSVEYLQGGVEARGTVTGRRQLLQAEMALHQGASDEAATTFEEALASGELDGALATRARLGLALAHEASGRLPRALELLRELERERARDGRQPFLPLAVALARCHRAAGDVAEALRVAEEGLERARELGLVHSGEYLELATTLVAALADRGEVERALGIVRGLTPAPDGAATLEARAAEYREGSVLAEQQGDLAQATHLAERAVALHGEAYDLRSLADLQTAWAWLSMHVPDVDVGAATRQLEAALATLGRVGDQTALACAEMEMARARLLDGRREAALELAARSLERLGPDGRQQEVVYARMILGECQQALGRPDEARACYAAAAATLAGMPPSRQVASMWNELGKLRQAAGDSDGALDAYSHAVQAAGLGTPLHGVSQGR